MLPRQALRVLVPVVGRVRVRLLLLWGVVWWMVGEGSGMRDEGAGRHSSAQQQQK